jgi:hypothetical protein
MGRGSATLAYRPIPFEGRSGTTDVGRSTWASAATPGSAWPTEADRAARRDPPPAPALEDCPGDLDPNGNVNFDGMPELEVFDVAASEWRRLPHLDPGPALQPRLTGTLRRAVDGHAPRALRQRNMDSVSFNLGVDLSGVVG